MARRKLPPATMLGQTPDELEMRDITPRESAGAGIAARIQAAAQNAQEAQEGFSHTHVASEIETLSSGDPEPQETASVSPKPTDAPADDGDLPGSSSADYSPIVESARKLVQFAMDARADIGEATGDDLTAKIKEWRAALEASKNTHKEHVAEADYSALQFIVFNADKVIKGEKTLTDAIASIAEKIGATPDMIGG